MITIDKENYFDVYEAMHAFLNVNHEGQCSLKYELSCQSEFKPGPMWSETRVMEENYYFNEITEENFEQVWKDLKAFEYD